MIIKDIYKDSDVNIDVRHCHNLEIITFRKYNSSSLHITDCDNLREIKNCPVSTTIFRNYPINLPSTDFKYTLCTTKAILDVPSFDEINRNVRRIWLCDGSYIEDELRNAGLTADIKFLITGSNI